MRVLCFAARGRVHQVYRVTVVATLVAILVWAALLLMVHPVAGAIDRGDFYRVGSAAGIEVTAPPRAPSGRPLVRVRYELRDSDHEESRTSAAVIARLAEHLDLWGSESTFDLRDLATVYLAACAGLIAFALAWGTPPLLCLLVTWVLCDAGYLVYFNSLYSEPAWLAGMFGLTLWLTRWGHSPGAFWRVTNSRWATRAALLLVLLLLTGMSRLPAAVTPLLVGMLLFGGWLTVRPAWNWRGTLLGTALALVIVLPPLHFAAAGGPRYEHINAFHSVFLGPVAASDEPKAALRRLGLSEQLVELRGKSFFETQLPGPARQAIETVSRLDVAGAYLADPPALLRVARRVQRQLASGMTSIDYETAEASPRHETPWRFARLRAAVVGFLPLLVWGVLVSALGLAAASWRGRFESATSPAVLAFLTLTTLSQVPITILGDGLFGLGRHLLVARFAFDLLLVLLAWEALCLAKRRLKARDGREPRLSASRAKEPT